MAVVKQLYLDTRDLIELLRGQPIGLDDFAATLHDEEWELVYSFANTCELAIPQNLHETCRRFGILAELPHSYIRGLPPIREIEFGHAVVAYAQGTDPREADVFVPAWYQTFSYPNQDADHAGAARMSLPDQVVGMASLNPDIFRNKPEHMEDVQLAVDEDRTVTDAVRRNRARFEGAVRCALAEAGVPIPTTGLTKFARWVRENPIRCPGWRIFQESYLEFCTNVQDRVDLGDLSDWSHVSVVPYVDAITLDRRVAGYTKATSLKLSELNPEVRYADRVFASAEGWLRSL
jgi:hypothetical protein